MKQKEIIVPYDSMPQLHTGSFLTKEQVEQFKDVSKNIIAVIRCKDCIHYRYYGLSKETISECTIDHTENPGGDWFCADGERE